jgi:tRNA pseudouridine38-40 synthase
MRVALKFAYAGKNFNGYARQPNLKTVEGAIIDLLASHGFIQDTKESIFRSASRTDKGVSSLGSVVAFNTDKLINNILQELNITSKEVLFYGVKEVDPDFYPRYAKQRIYRYYLKNDGFDIKKIISVSSLFTGTHNFTNFARIEEGKNPERTIDNIVIGETKNFVTFDFYAQTFLWHQIRRIISSIEKAVIGKIEKEQILDALDKPELKVDYGVSPAEPLILKNIIYGFNFEYDNNCFDRLKMFENKIIRNI